MDWKKSLWKAAKAAAIMAVSLFAVTFGDHIIAILKDRPDAWAALAVAVVTALLDWLKHRKDPPKPKT